ncbi:hypothetical protein HPP92_010655 [Vanilla planifolia]|uniref:Uncharacterized protein n=1 Tax=Vanilla planifolia TaxID=51239 RepID=A0A835UZH4_VANPL|nr:hypothetical protein HPP92_010655 [Vanilla planifolia]
MVALSPPPRTFHAVIDHWRGRGADEITVTVHGSPPVGDTGQLATRDSGEERSSPSSGGEAGMGIGLQGAGKVAGGETVTGANSGAACDAHATKAEVERGRVVGSLIYSPSCVAKNGEH